MDETIIEKTDEGYLSVKTPIDTPIEVIGGKYYSVSTTSVFSKDEIKEQIRMWTAEHENRSGALHEATEKLAYYNSLKTQADDLGVVEEKQEKIEELIEEVKEIVEEATAQEETVATEEVPPEKEVIKSE